MYFGQFKLCILTNLTRVEEVPNLTKVEEVPSLSCYLELFKKLFFQDLTFRHIRTLQQENKELRAALEEHQNALELIMSKYRQHVTK